MKANEIKKVSVVDLSDYDPNLCCNGGRYAFYTDYLLEDNGLWTVIYGTSADMSFCPACGSFGCDECTDYERISTGEMLRRLAEDADREGVTIECYNADPEEDDELVIRVDE